MAGTANPGGANSVATLPPGLQSQHGTPFVGRDRELSTLEQLWNRAKPARRGVFLGGEPGIGKSRLASEFAQRAHAKGAAVLLGRSDPDRDFPYQPFVEILEQYGASCPRDRLEEQLNRLHAGELTKLVPRFEEAFPELAAGTSGDPVGERQRLFDAVSTLLSLAAENMPLVVVLEDLHWADRPTLRMLRHVIRAPGPGGPFLLACYRTTDLQPDSALAELLADTRISALCARLYLRGLSESALSELVSAIVGSPPSATLSTSFHRATNGNPLFAAAVARQLQDLGADTAAPPGGGPAPDALIEAAGIPDTAREAIGRRLSRLSARAQDLLAAAAVIGPEFSLDLLESMSELEPLALIEALEEAIAAGLVEEQPTIAGASCTFAHSLVRAAIYERTDPERAQHLHLLAADGLEHLYAARLEEHLPELAHHFLSAGALARGRAADYAARAGARAFEQLAYEAAARQYEAALRSLGPDERRRALDLRLALAEAHWRSGQFEEARENYSTAASIGAGLALPNELAAAALGFGGRSSFGAGLRDDRMIELLEWALDAREPHDDPLRARLLGRLGEALTFSGEAGSRNELIEHGLGMARRLNDSSVLGAVLENAHFALWGPDNPRERVAMSEEMVKLGQRADDTLLETHGHLWRAVDLLDCGEVAQADDALEKFAEMAGQTRQRYELWALSCLRALRVLMDGRIAEAEELAAHALELGQRDRNQNALQIYGVQLAGVRRERGTYAELEEPLKVFIDQYPAIPTWRCALAFLYADAGRPDDARRELDILGVDAFGGLPRDLFWLAAMTLVGQAAAFAEARDHAAVIYDLLAPYSRRNVIVAVAACWGSASRVLALLAQALGRSDEAASYFEEAIEHNLALGARTWHARSLVEYAMLLRDGGDTGRAQELLRDALLISRELDLVDIGTRAETALSAS